MVDGGRQAWSCCFQEQREAGPCTLVGQAGGQGRRRRNRGQQQQQQAALHPVVDYNHAMFLSRLLLARRGPATKPSQQQQQSWRPRSAQDHRRGQARSSASLLLLGHSSSSPHHGGGAARHRQRPTSAVPSVMRSYLPMASSTPATLAPAEGWAAHRGGLGGSFSPGRRRGPAAAAGAWLLDEEAGGVSASQSSVASAGGNSTALQHRPQLSLGASASVLTHGLTGMGASSQGLPPAATIRVLPTHQPSTDCSLFRSHGTSTSSTKNAAARRPCSAYPVGKVRVAAAACAQPSRSRPATAASSSSAALPAAAASFRPGASSLSHSQALESQKLGQPRAAAAF